MLPVTNAEFMKALHAQNVARFIEPIPGRWRQRNWQCAPSVILQVLPHNNTSQRVFSRLMIKSHALIHHDKRASMDALVIALEAEDSARIDVETAKSRAIIAAQVTSAIAIPSESVQFQTPIHGHVLRCSTCC